MGLTSTANQPSPGHAFEAVIVLASRALPVVALLHGILQAPGSQAAFMDVLLTALAEAGTDEATPIHALVRDGRGRLENARDGLRRRMERGQDSVKTNAAGSRSVEFALLVLLVLLVLVGMMIVVRRVPSRVDRIRGWLCTVREVCRGTVIICPSTRKVARPLPLGLERGGSHGAGQSLGSANIMQQYNQLHNASEGRCKSKSRCRSRSKCKCKCKQDRTGQATTRAS